MAPPKCCAGKGLMDSGGGRGGGGGGRGGGGGGVGRRGGRCKMLQLAIF